MLLAALHKVTLGAVRQPDNIPPQGRIWYCCLLGFFFPLSIWTVTLVDDTQNLFKNIFSPVGYYFDGNHMLQTKMCSVSPLSTCATAPLQSV